MVAILYLYQGFWNEKFGRPNIYSVPEDLCWVGFPPGIEGKGDFYSLDEVPLAIIDIRLDPDQDSARWGSVYAFDLNG